MRLDEFTDSRAERFACSPARAQTSAGVVKRSSHLVLDGQRRSLASDIEEIGERGSEVELRGAEPNSVNVCAKEILVHEIDARRRDRGPP
jgi:hypothetical protein